MSTCACAHIYLYIYIEIYIVPTTEAPTREAYIQSATGASTCPSGSDNIADETTCQKAGAALDLHWIGAFSSTSYQGGCITSMGAIGLNTFQGSTHSGFALVCKALTTRAPTTPAHICVFA